MSYFLKIFVFSQDIQLYFLSICEAVLFEQTVQTQNRLLLAEKSDLGLPSLPFANHIYLAVRHGFSLSGMTANN